MISALICTRNRPEALARAVRSLLAPEGGSEAESELEVIVVDQSDPAQLEQARRALPADPRLRHSPAPPRGKGVALNLGLDLARSEIVVCTDDDCVAPPGWPASMARALQAHPSAAVAFCSVLGAPHDAAAGYVPGYTITRSRLLRSVGETRAGHGMGAGMALRRAAVLALGGFDESIGPGGRFPSGDDWDIAIRALLLGAHVYETAEVSIVHEGFRSFAEGREHARRDWLAIGAVCAKPLRAGRWSAVPVGLWAFAGQALWPPLFDLLRLRRPRGAARVQGFLEGFRAGLATRVDREKLLYAPRP
jgi:glycosyltransferase involved in cell wall biosynthesis